MHLPLLWKALKTCVTYVTQIEVLKAFSKLSHVFFFLTLEFYVLRGKWNEHFRTNSHCTVPPKRASLVWRLCEKGGLNFHYSMPASCAAMGGDVWPVCGFDFQFLLWKTSLCRDKMSTNQGSQFISFFTDLPPSWGLCSTWGNNDWRAG